MKKLMLLAGVFSLLQACGSGETDTDMSGLEYPKTAKVAVTDTFFGVEVEDPYRWLESPDSQAVTDWVEAQNKVTFGYLEKIPFREKIRERLTAVWDYPKYGVPHHRGEHYFFHKNDGLQAQSVLYMQDGLDGEPRVCIDPNKFSEDGTVSLTTFSVSKDGNHAVYGKSEGGSDWNEYFVRNLETGEDETDHLEWIKFSGAAWKDDGFFYGRFPEPTEGEELSNANEHKKIYYHKLGTDQSEDELIYEEPEHPRRGIYASTTEDERFLLLFMSEGATNNNALFVKDLDKPSGEMIKLVETFDYSFDVIDNVGNTLLISTNYEAPRYRVIAVDLANPARENWKTLIPESEEVLDGVTLAGGRIFAQYLKDAQSRIRIFETDGSPAGEVKLPGIGTVGGLAGRKEDDKAFFTFTSYVYPPTIFQLNTKDGSTEVYRASEVKFDVDAYETKQVFVTSKDGEKIPMFITHKKGLELDGNNPTLLYGYGGFNINILPGFSISNTVLLENGGVYAVVNLRGGGEYGEKWHEAGMLLKKQNVFDDFISAAEYLVDQKYTKPERLAAMGGSNGGLLVGAVTTQRPDLFGVAIPRVGVMDMLRYHKFTIGHAWMVEYGNPEDSLHFNNLYGYSPLHNLKKGTDYPATLVMTADHDDRVVPAHSFKYISRLQECHSGKDPVLIRIETMAGHGAGKPTEKIIEETADMWSFMFHEMGVEVKY